MAAEIDRDDLNKLKISFTKISPSLENLSEFLSILGANANLQLVGKSPIKETDEVFGYVGHGSVDTVLRNAHPIDGTKLVKLNEMTDGEVAACLLNLVYPRAFSRESLHGIDVSCELRNNKDLFLEAAFAQQFIAKKEGMLLADAEDAIFHMFAFVPQNDGKMMLLHDGFCYDVTAYFEKHVWNLDGNGHRRATFVHLLESASFKMRDGCMYAVVADKKLIIARELKQLQQLYSEKYGNYEIDKSMTPEDWADMSSLNASISEAEAFELEVDDENSPQKVQAAADSSALQSDERYELFQQIEQLEKKLWLEQERFEYSMIPGEDVREARNSFYKAIVLSCTENAPKTTSKAGERTRNEAKSTVTPLKETNKGNVSRRKSATPKQSSKRAAKWHSESRDSRCHHVTSKRRRT